MSLLLAEPRTGRTHQIRSHVSHIGHPIALWLIVETLVVLALVRGHVGDGEEEMPEHKFYRKARCIVVLLSLLARRSGTRSMLRATRLLTTLANEYLGHLGVPVG